MKLMNEITFDFDLTGPKVIASAHVAIIENVKRIMTISCNSVTADTGKFFVSVTGKELRICEIWEGRMELEGIIEGIEFYQTLAERQTGRI